MPINTIVNPLSAEHVAVMTQAAKALASLDHYLKLGSIADRKMADLAHTHQAQLQTAIDQDNARRQMKNLSFPNDI